MKDEPPTPRHSVPRRLSRPRRASVDDEIIATPTAVRAAARAALKEEEVRPAAIETPRQPAKLIPRPPPVLMSRDSSASVAKTFLTAIVPGRRRSRRQKEVLRPPSPLDSVQPPCDYVDTGSMSELPAPANYMGMQAMQQFWDIFHRQETVHNNKAVPPTVPSVVPRPKSARTNYLAAVRNLRLCPEPLGIVRRRVVDKTASYANGSTVQEVNLSSYRMGNAYAEAFGEGFSLLPGVESLNLTHNRIGDLVASRLITAAAAAAGAQGTAGLQQLNLSHNALATASSRALSELMRRSRALTSLNLSHTGLRDRQVQQLCESLTMNQTVVRLHLSENRFGAPGMLAVARFLEENSRIEELYLAWNQLRGVGALRIVEALKFHASLRVCDLSWNALSSSGPNLASGTGNSAIHSSGGVLLPRAVVAALADSLANNKVLAHLDLSSNRFDLEDCNLLAKQLEKNQTLIGLHMSGNCAVMDSRGFLIPKTQADDEEGGGSRRLRDQHKLYSVAVFEEVHSDAGPGVFPAHLMSIVDASCWYCGLWAEHRFTWTPTAGQGPFAGTIDRFEITPSMEVRLHLSVDDWRGVAMERRENDGDEVAFSALRVIPPGATCYFFTAVDTAAGPNSSNNVSFHYVTSRPNRPVQRQHRLPPGKSGTCSLGASEAGEATGATQGGVFGTLERLNVIRFSERGGRDPCNTLVPRSSGNNNGRRGKWDINKSVFARRKRESECRSFVDTDVFIAKACAADWKQCKIDRFVKDSSRRREVEVGVTRWYRTVCNAYRRYCGHNVLMNLAPLGSLTSAAAIQLQNDITCIPWSGYTEFLSEAKILDETSEYCSLPDLENVFVAANLELTQEAKEKDNPDRSLTRLSSWNVLSESPRTNTLEVRTLSNLLLLR